MRKYRITFHRCICDLAETYTPVHVLCLCERLCMVVYLCAPWGRLRHPLAGLLLVFKNESQGQHIPHLSLQRERAGVAVVRLSSVPIGEKHGPKNRAPCHAHKKKERSPDDTSLCQIAVSEYQQPVGRHLEQAADWGRCDGTKSWERCWRFCHRDNASSSQFIPRFHSGCGAEDVFPHWDGV